MEVKTIRDILTWTQQYHEQLERCYAHCANEAEEERIRLLMDYFKSHQTKLSETLGRVIQGQQEKVLNTWSLEYSVQQKPFLEHVCQYDLGDLSADEITGKVVAAHQAIIDLYKELASQTHINDAHELFQSLLELEEHELMQEMVSAQRFADL